MEIKDRSSFGEEGSAFNMALATLERVNEILKEITLCSISTAPTQNAVWLLFRKYKLVRQLYLASVPLINNDEAKKSLKNQIVKLKNQFKQTEDERVHKVNLIYLEDTDEKLDDVCEKIQEALQKEKYFMPSKADPRVSWRQG